MERKIGEIFEANDKWYQCVEDTEYISCIDCCFYNGGHKLCTDKDIGNCVREYRSDAKSICFKKLEKVGEPVTEKGKIFQKLISNDSSCKGCVFNIPNKSCDKDIYVDGPCPDNEIWVEIKQTKEDMEEKKLNLKPFDIQKAKEGKPVCTRDGRKARIICFDRVTNSTNEYTGHLIVLVTNPNGDEQSFYYTEKGNLAGEDEYDNHKWDLMMLPEKKSGWVNLYKRENEYICENECNVFTGITVYKSEGEAKRNIDKNEIYLNTIKINWEE